MIICSILTSVSRPRRLSPVRSVMGLPSRSSVPDRLSTFSYFWQTLLPKAQAR